MIYLEKLKLFPFKTQEIALQQNKYNFIFFSENEEFLDYYEKLNIKRIHCRKILLNYSGFLKIRYNTNLIKIYKSLGLIPVKDLTAQKDNVYIDFTNIVQHIEYKYGNNYKNKVLQKHILNQLKRFTFLSNVNHKENILCYTINLEKDFSPGLFSKRIFPILLHIKEGTFKTELNLDYFLLNLFLGNSIYTLLIKKSEQLPYTRIRNLLLNLAPEITKKNFEQAENTLETATKKIINKISNVIKKENVQKISYAVSNYLKTNSSLINKIVNDKITDKNDILNLTIKSIVKSNKLINDEVLNSKLKNIDSNDKEKIFKNIQDNLVKDLPENISPQNNNKNILYQDIDINALNDFKEPSPIIQKRVHDFNNNFIEDLKSVFKLLEKKEPPLKIIELKTKDLPILPDDLNPSLMQDVYIKLKDDLGNIHEVNFQIPKVDENGIMLINGKKKFLIYQIILDPIYFLKKDMAKFETLYASIAIHLKQLRNKQYFDIYISGYTLPLFVFMGYYIGFDNTCKLYNMKYTFSDKKDLNANYYFKTKDDVWFNFYYDNNSKECFYLLESLAKSKLIFSKDDLYDKKYYMNNIIKIIKNRNAIYNIDLIIKNIVEPISLDVLKSKNEPTELDKIIYYICVEMAKGRVDDRNDIFHQRIRSSEVFIHQIEKLVIGAHSDFRTRRLMGDKKADYYLDAEHTVKELINSKLVRDLENINPIEELSCLTRITPVGPGGIDDPQAITMDSRNIHPSYYGEIAPMDTPEGCVCKNQLVKIDINKFEKLKNLNINDYILWIDNKKYKIINKINRRKRKYIIVTDYGEIKCSKDHKWPVYDKYESKEKILTTKEILKDINRYKLIRYLN